MGYPLRVHIQEVGPRDGLQIEPGTLPLAARNELIGLLAAAGLAEIEIGSFVNPKAVPQMARTGELARMITPRDGTTYRALWLNLKGMQLAKEAGGAISMDGKLHVSASSAFSTRNTNRSTEQTIASLPDWISTYGEMDILTQCLVVMAAFGCNFEGPVSTDQVLSVIERTETILNASEQRLCRVILADTMGWANPEHVRNLVRCVQDRWPHLRIRLHLHDTRGLAMANALAGLEEGVCEFDASVGGLGGCPFSGSRGAVGNICTEDLVFLCDQLGIETGIDLEKLITAAHRTEELVGHKLPGRLMRSGPLPAPGTIPGAA